MLYIVLAYLMLFAALTNSVCLNNASFFFLFKYFLCQGYELSGEIALKNNHYYYYYTLSVFCWVSNVNLQAKYIIIAIVFMHSFVHMLNCLHTKVNKCFECLLNVLRLNFRHLSRYTYFQLLKRLQNIHMIQLLWKNATISLI